MGHQGLNALVLRFIQRILRVHLIEGIGPAQIGPQILLLDAPLGELHADLADLVIAFGLVQGTPTVPDRELDFVLLLDNGPRGAVAVIAPWGWTSPGPVDG